jgi:hypothetical protein
VNDNEDKIKFIAVTYWALAWLDEGEGNWLGDL